MYIVAIAWLFTSLMISVAQTSLVAALLNFLFWGVLPLSLLLWLIGTPSRLRNKSELESRNGANSNEFPPDQ